jgi:hypothetical protein
MLKNRMGRAALRALAMALTAGGGLLGVSAATASADASTPGWLQLANVEDFNTMQACHNQGYQDVRVDFLYDAFNCVQMPGYVQLREYLNG